jgi:hypothetical protein
MCEKTLEKLFEGFATPKFRDMTDEECKTLRLLYNDGCRVPFAVESTSIVWAVALKESSPTYRLYNLGTNDLRVFRYTPEKDMWERIEYTEISNLYGLLWIMCLNIKGIGARC